MAEVKFKRSVVVVHELLVACANDVVPWPGIEPRPPALGARSLTHWTTRKVAMLILELHEYSLFSFFSIQHKVSSTSVILLQTSWCGMFILQLVYKVKSNDILEKLALSSLDTSEQTKWQKLVNEAKENLHKIQVCFPCCILEYSWTCLLMPNSIFHVLPFFYYTTWVFEMNSVTPTWPAYL